MKILSNLSPNFSKIKRAKKDIKFVIYHYTGMQSEIESINRLKSLKSKVSCHYFLNRKGQIIKMVDENKIAWHAGKSKWKNFENLNKYSIGIELVNKGHKFGYQNFTRIQIKNLIKLSLYLKKKYKIKSDNFLGHSDIAPLRKIDPGEKFPWQKLSKYGLGKWYVNKKNYMNKTNYRQRSFFKNLHKIGYRYFSLNQSRKDDRLIISSFQRKYLAKEVTGKISQKTLKISHFLKS